MPQTVRLSPDSSIKLLEEPCLYNRRTDELYTVSEEAVGFLGECVRGVPRPATGEAAKFVAYCLGEDLMQIAEEPEDRRLTLQQSPAPSLRYLLLHITDRCNLKCRHCFLGEAGQTDLPLDEIKAIIDEFEKMQGLRLMISGGEPLLHKDFWELNEFVAGKNLRSILLSNGRLIDEKTARRLRFQEVQVSLDGMNKAHAHLRGAGTFDQAVGAIKALGSSGVQVSVATMVHQENLEDFESLGGLMCDLGVREWSIDVPSPAGRLAENTALLVNPETAGPLLEHAFGGAIHSPSPGFACGAHLMAVMADGNAARCGFYADRSVGSIREGLAACWQKIEPMPLDQLECDCEFIENCRGGCRFRASGYNKKLYGPDLCQCHRYGILRKAF